MQYHSLQWVLDRRNISPGSGGLGTLSIVNGQVEGRPAFAPWTQEYLRNNPAQARRHIIAWHLLRDLMNELINNNPAGIAGVAQSLGSLAILAPDEVLNGVVNKLEQVPARTYGDMGEVGKVILKILYIMNSNPGNLWLGNSIVNSLLPGIRKRSMDALEAASSLQMLIDLARYWASEEDRDTVDSTAHVVTGMTILRYWEETSKYINNEEEYRAVWERSLELARNSLEHLEIDLTPGSKEEAANLADKSSGMLSILAMLLHRDRSQPDLIRDLFGILLTYPEPETDGSADVPMGSGSQ